MGKIKYILILFLLGCNTAYLLNTQSRVLTLDQWQYILIDSSRIGNDIVKNWGSFGLDFADGNDDGFGDILVGKNFYLNPGKNPLKGWQKSTIRDTTDNMFIINIDDDEYADVIGLSCNQQYWFKATDKECKHWKQIQIGNQPICSHKMTSMGYCKADVFAGGKPELFFTDPRGTIYCFEIPDDPATFWPVFIITKEGGSDKFLTGADIDGDGDIDLITACKINQKKYFNNICWFENPGTKTGNWKRHIIGEVEYTADHLVAVDFNGNGVCEILVSEGRSPEEYPAGIYMFKAPSKNVFSNNWEKKLITTQYSTNSLETADIDQDGDMDFVTGEHKGPRRLQIWENDGLGNFICHIIDSLKESHNGVRLFDIEGDGDLDIVSSGWYDKSVHLWINKAIK